MRRTSAIAGRTLPLMCRAWVIGSSSCCDATFSSASTAAANEPTIATYSWSDLRSRASFTPEDSVAAFPVLGSKKTVDLFKKYGVLNKAEVDSRLHITVEKYVKQKTIEAETMVQMSRQQILPAALEHQRRTAEALGATEGSGVKDARLRKSLQEYVSTVGSFAAAVDALEKAAAHHDDDPMTHARHIKGKVRPAMAEVRRIADALEQVIADDLWPMPTYRDLLFLK